MANSGNRTFKLNSGLPNRILSPKKQYNNDNTYSCNCIDLEKVMPRSTRQSNNLKLYCNSGRVVVGAGQ